MTRIHLQSLTSFQFPMKSSIDAHAMNIEDRGEKVHLLGGFTTEEESDNDNLFKPDIPQNLKAGKGRGIKGGDSQYDGLEEHGSVQTMEFPASDDDLPTASSFDNVVVVDLPDSVSTGGNADLQTSVKYKDKSEEHLASMSNDVNVGTEAKEPATKITKETSGSGIAEDVPTETNKTKGTVPTMPNATSASNAAIDTTEDLDNFDSWRTDDTQDEEGSSSFLPESNEEAPKQNEQDPTDAPMTFPSLLGTGTGVDWDESQ